ncbi:hypothetical protein RJT34_22882 [Clitoria ternatea]|uniref:Uncharacterized protein n=1 Tax=Clitoria ternatea TaxID=43366 RepID=A0AAN9FTN6_CLITE
MRDELCELGRNTIGVMELVGRVANLQSLLKILLLHGEKSLKARERSRSPAIVALPSVHAIFVIYSHSRALSFTGHSFQHLFYSPKLFFPPNTFLSSPFP